jgi:hypothetical protein
MKSFTTYMKHIEINRIPVTVPVESVSLNGIQKLREHQLSTVRLVSFWCLKVNLEFEIIIL